MKIYTSYFANVKNLIKDNIQPIGIALYPPSGFNYPTLGCLAPYKSLLEGIKQGKITQEQYKEIYIKDYSCMFYNENLLNSIENLSNGKDVALCCFEKPEDFCHRHIVADLFKSYYNIDVQEYKKYEATSIKLF